MTGFAHQQSPGITGGFQLRLPASTGNPGQALRLSNSFPLLEWFTPPSGGEFEAYRAAIPIKYPASAVTTANVTLSGAPASADTDDVDFSFGGILLVRAQSDDTENGLYEVNPGGAWTRHITMPDNGSSARGAIVPVFSGGTLYGNTIWFSTTDGGGSVPFVQVPTLSLGALSTPRLTSTERDALTPVNGMLIYNTTTDKFQGYEAGTWVDLI